MIRIPKQKGLSLALPSLYIHIVTGRIPSPSTQQSLGVKRKKKKDVSKINVESGRSKEKDESSSPAVAQPAAQ